MRNVPLLFPFFLALFAAIFSPALLLGVRLIAFAPFLAMSYYRLNFSKALWTAFFCGLALDCFNSQFRFGMTAVNYTLVTFFLFSQKRHFFEDKPFPILFFTAIISAFSTLIQLFSLYCLDNHFSFTTKAAILDFLAMPLVDGLYGFIWLFCPMKCYDQIKRLGWRGLWLKLKIKEAISDEVN